MKTSNLAGASMNSWRLNLRRARVRDQTAEAAWITPPAMRARRPPFARSRAVSRSATSGLRCFGCFERLLPDRGLRREDGRQRAMEQRAHRAQQLCFLHRKLLVVRDAADQALDSAFFAKGPQFARRSSASPSACGHCADIAVGKPVLGQRDRDTGLVGAARARIVAGALPGEDREQRADRLGFLQQRSAAVRRAGFQLVARLADISSETALEHIDARVGFAGERHDVAQLLALVERQPAQRGKQLLDGGQPQLRRQRIGERLKPRTRAVNAAPYALSRTRRCSASTSGTLLSQHHEQQRARMIG